MDRRFVELQPRTLSTNVQSFIIHRPQQGNRITICVIYLGVFNFHPVAMYKLRRIFGHRKSGKKQESSSPDDYVTISHHQLSWVSRGPMVVYRNPAENYEYTPYLSSSPSSSSSLSSSTSTSFKSRSSEVILLDADPLQHKVHESVLSFAIPYSLDGEIHGSTSDLGSDLYLERCYSADDEASGDGGDWLIRPRFRITNWQKGSHLGNGSFGTVYEGFCSEGMFFAIKVVSLLAQGNQGRESVLSLQAEIEVLRQLQHKNIVQYLGTAMDDANLFIFLELVTKGSLASLCREYVFPDSVVSAYTRQILSGLRYLHSRNIVHRNIKCANILVTSTGTLKLADFGLVKDMHSNDFESCERNILWMAPEVVNGRRNQGYGTAADIWSLGCTVLEMATRLLPYHPMSTMKLST